MVTRLEAIAADGTPLGEEQRYRLPNEDDDFGFREYIRSLFFAPKGYYRFIAFVVSDKPYTTADEALPEREALKRLRRGASRLPRSYEQLPFSQHHRIDALIYEFRKVDSRGEVQTLRPGRLLPQQHMRNAGLTAAFSGLLAP